MDALGDGTRRLILERLRSGPRAVGELAAELPVSRPAGSRLSAAASPQSAVVAGRAELEQRVADLRGRHGDDPPRPESWGGYRLAPATWEFWQHREDRLHDRLRYRRDGTSWLVERLAP